MMQLPKFIFINGPAGSGKSTLATMLCEANTKVWRESFAEPIREMLYAVFFPNEGVIERTIDFRDGTIKKRNLLQFAGLKVNHVCVDPLVRQAMIDFSERYMKPNFGQDIFGQLLLARCQEQETWYDHFVIDDSGFAPEAQVVIAAAGAEHCLLIRLHRDGCDFVGDSRGYIDLAVRTLDIHNNAEPAAMLDTLQANLSL